jgi:hypothetical protein
MQEDVARLDIVLLLSAQQTLIQLPDIATEKYPHTKGICQQNANMKVFLKKIVPKRIT